MTTKAILTPKQVEKFRRWADIGSIALGYNLRRALIRTLDSHEALREQLAKAQADVRALTEAVAQPEHSHSHFLDDGHEGCVFCRGWQMRKAVLARPGVGRLMEEQDAKH